ncbi:MAG: hypothetical protein ACYTBV_18350 [Planctomycetota bacterium]
MKRKYRRPEQIVRLLRQAEARLSEVRDRRRATGHGAGMRRGHLK